MKISSEKRFNFSNIILKRWLLKVGPVRRKAILTKIKEDFLRLGSFTSTARKGFLQLYSHPVIPIRRIPATQHVKNQRPRNGEENWHSVISNQEIRRPYDANNNVKNSAPPDINRDKTSPMGPSNSGVGSQFGCINQRPDCATAPSTKVEKTIDVEKKNNTTEDRSHSGHRDSEKKSRNRERKEGGSRSWKRSRREKSAARKLTRGENPNKIPWQLFKIDPESLPKPHSLKTKLRWMRDERKRKREQLFAKIIEIFGEDSDEDIGYRGLLSSARIPPRERKTTSESPMAVPSAEKSILPLDVDGDRVAEADVEVQNETSERISQFFASSKTKMPKKRTTESKDETIVFERKKSKSSMRPSAGPSLATKPQFRDYDTSFSSSDVPSDPEDRNYRPRHYNPHDANCSTSRDRITRRSVQRSSNECTTSTTTTTTTTTTTIAPPEPNNREKISADECSLDSASTTELWREKEVHDNDQDSGLNSDLSSANVSNSESAAASRQASVTRDEPVPMSKATPSCANVAHTIANNQDYSTITGYPKAENPFEPTPPTAAAETPPISDLKSQWTDSPLDSVNSESEKKPAMLLKTSPSRPARLSDANPIPSSTTTETESSDRLLGALDKIFLSLLSRRRINERQQSASKLAIKRNQQEEVLKAERELESTLAVFRDEINYLLENLGEWETVFCFISQGLNHRTPEGVDCFTQAEVRLAILDAKLEIQCKEMKEELPTSEANDISLVDNIITIDLTEEDERENGTEQDICDSSTDPVQPNSHEVYVDVKPKLADDCSTSEESAELKHDLNANEIPLTVPSIAEVKTISRQQFETIGEKPSSLTQDEDLCLVCLKTSHVACGRCFKASYCSKDCQELHWEQFHHVTCVLRQVPAAKNSV